jgi:hypothetical protein
MSTPNGLTEPSLPMQQLKRRCREGRDMVSQITPQISKHGDPLEFLLNAMEDETQPMSLRIQAAEAAAQYLRPALSIHESRTAPPDGATLMPSYLTHVVER